MKEPLKEPVNSLGIHHDSAFSFKAQVMSGVQLCLVHSYCHYWIETSAMVTHTLVTSCYCNVLCVVLSLETVWKLQLAENVAARALDQFN